MKVLRENAKNKHRFEVAKSYLQGRLTDFRCEERRRVSSQIYACTQQVTVVKTGFWTEAI